jgi:hypothetical protein
LQCCLPGTADSKDSNLILKNGKDAAIGPTTSRSKVKLPHFAINPLIFRRDRVRKRVRSQLSRCCKKCFQPSRRSSGL